MPPKTTRAPTAAAVAKARADSKGTAATKRKNGTARAALLERAAARKAALAAPLDDGSSGSDDEGSEGYGPSTDDTSDGEDNVTFDSAMLVMLIETLGFSKAAANELVRQGLQSMYDLMQFNPALLNETYKDAAHAKMPNSGKKIVLPAICKQRLHSYLTWTVNNEAMWAPGPVPGFDKDTMKI